MSSPADASGPDAPAAGRATRSAVLLVAVMLGTLVNLFHPHPGAVALVGVAALGFLVRERWRMPPSIRRVTTVLGILTVVLLPLANEPFQSLSRGVAIGGMMISVIASVTLMARAALNSPKTDVVARYLLGSGLRSRYLVLSLACQLFGGLMGMAGVSMLMDMAAKGEVPVDEDRQAMVAALMRSLAAATLWSPMFSNLTILLALYPGLKWTLALPLCLAMAGCAIVLGTLLDLWRQRGRVYPARAPLPRGPLLRALVPMVLAMAGFLALVITFTHTLHVPVVAGLILLIPLVVLGLHTLQSPAPRRLAQATERLREDYLKLPALAGEAALFMAAGCGGTVIASVIPANWISAIGGVLALSPFLACLALMGFILALAMMAVHPVLSVVLVGSAFPPEMVGLPPIIHMATIMVVWGLASYATPFSMMALMASRYFGYPITTVTLRLNRVFAPLYLTLTTLFLGSIALLQRGPT
ncbi:hypothetical protein [Hydrogenophaga sp.]|uniref:hypothetical protein n=1 Tax=Hydrogenophaga sp. TaxID=1904254 RepID=UPI0026256B55|nr:hypothetical protein [Hydrogenophaga sp.]MCW5653791.1 hypothetical protein [Hydrogenophaga sp.]